MPANLSKGMQLLDMIEDEVVREITSEWILGQAKEMGIEEDKIHVSNLSVIRGDAQGTTVNVEYIFERQVVHVEYKLIKHVGPIERR